jgi:hypothetical protein
VALRNTRPYYDWVDRELPSLQAKQVARTFVADLGEMPWLAPSIPIAELSRQPHYEVRSALLTVRAESPVQIWYRHEYATGDVDLIDVTSLPLP